MTSYNFDESLFSPPGHPSQKVQGHVIRDVFRFKRGEKFGQDFSGKTQFTNISKANQVSAVCFLVWPYDDPMYRKYVLGKITIFSDIIIEKKADTT